MTTYIFGTACETVLVIKKDDAGRVEKVAGAREAFHADEALTRLAILLAELDLAGVTNVYERSAHDCKTVGCGSPASHQQSSLGKAILESKRILREAGR